MRTATASLLALVLPALVTAGGGGGGGPGHGHDGPGKDKPGHGGGGHGDHGDHGDHKKPLVTSEKLQSRIKLKDLVGGSQKLQDIANANGGHRAFGSGGHNATVDYLYKTLKSLNYYDVVKQPFTEIYSSADGSLTVDGQPIEVTAMTYTPGGEATKPLVAVANLGCDAADYPAEVAGNIALISRGECSFGQKSLNAKAAGAVGAVIYNNVAGELSGTLGEALLDYAPVVGISLETGQALLEKLAAGEVTAALKLDAIVEDRVTYNVIAETKGGDHNNVLMLGGHSDSVPAGPGINDDGSGTIGILAVAKALTKFRVKNAVRFAFWSAEEFGLLGSEHYIRTINGSISGSAAELAKVRAYLNFDMIASPNYIYGIYDGNGDAFNMTGPAGSDAIEKGFEDFFKRKRTPSVPTEFSGRSDYAAFIENGIPSGGLFTGAEVNKTAEEAALFGGEAGVAYDINYHKAGDTVDNLALDAFFLNTQAIADSVAKYARSFESLPPVEAKQRRWDAERAAVLRRSGGSHGHGPHTHTHSAPCGGGPTI